MKNEAIEGQTHQNLLKIKIKKKIIAGIRRAAISPAILAAIGFTAYNIQWRTKNKLDITAKSNTPDDLIWFRF